MTSRELIAWGSLHERRARARWMPARWVIALLLGGAIAAWVHHRLGDGVVSASGAWLVASCITFGIGFVRVPFHIYWRADAALLAQLPLRGKPLFDAALVRCVRAAATMTGAGVLAALPLVMSSPGLMIRHVVVAVALGVGAAFLVPAIAIWAASLVALGQENHRVHAVRAAAGLAPSAGPPSSALLGALPGFAASIVFIGVLLIADWLHGGNPVVPASAMLGSLGVTSVMAIVLARRAAPAVMTTILRDVAALDRQRLATLEIRPPTALERAVAGLLGEGGLPHSKDARLMRRRYPMAFALGALAWIVLVVVGLATPDQADTWLTTCLVVATMYGLLLSRRLFLPPIELVRLSRTLPISRSAIHRAKLAWLLGWWTLYIALPAGFALARSFDRTSTAILVIGTGLLLVTARRSGRS